MSEGGIGADDVILSTADDGAIGVGLDGIPLAACHSATKGAGLDGVELPPAMVEAYAVGSILFA